MQQFKRRDFIKTLALGTAGISLTGLPSFSCSPSPHVPSYLKDYATLFNDNSHAAALQWFKDSKFGLFMHYGISSILGRGEWVQYRENIPLKDYVKLKDEFTAKNFDADFITDMALNAGMKYVNITSRHHDSFCLFDSKVSEYTSVNSPSKRDLVGELAEQCNKKGLGLFLYYSYALDWWHPYFYPRKYNKIARPYYENPDEVYKWRNDEDFQKYIEFVHTQLKELLTNYGELAGIWFDPIMGFYGQPNLFPIEETYAMIRKLQPQTLISFKQGATGTEDFAAPERSGHSMADRVLNSFDEKRAKIAEHAWEQNKNKHNEICDTLQPGAWGYRASDEGKHLKPEKVIEKLVSAVSGNFNLLLNTGPLPDGSIHWEDVASLNQVGKWIKENGESIYKANGGPFQKSFNVKTTNKSNNVYIHLMNYKGGNVTVPINSSKIKSVKYLDGRDINYRQNDENIILDLAIPTKQTPDEVVKVEFKGEINPVEFKDKKIFIDVKRKYKSIELKNDPSPKYSGQGTLTLEDGRRGSFAFTSNEWLGFEVDNFEAVVDLGESKDIKNIEVGFLEEQKSWIFFPKKVEYFISENKRDWIKVFSQKFEVISREDTKIKNFIQNNVNRKSKYVKIIAQNVKNCPMWHEGAGGKAWLFVDELIIE